MDEIWQQFHRLPRIIRDAAARPQALATIEKLESTYPKLDLASLVMRVMVKAVPVEDVPSVLEHEAAVTPEQAQEIALALHANVWEGAAGYLNVPVPPAAPVAAATPDLPSASPPLQPPAPIPVPPAPVMPRAPIGPLAPSPTLSVEDDAELEHHMARLRQLQTATGGEDFSSLVQRVLTQHSLAFGDEMMRKRADSILKAQMKGIRDEETTCDVLQRDPKVGGLGLDPDQARLVAHTVVDVLQQMKSQGRVSETPIPMPPSIEDLPQAKTEKPAAMPPIRLDGQLTPDTVPAAMNVTEPPRPSRPIVRPPDIPPPAPLPTTSEPMLSQPPVQVKMSAPARPSRQHDRRSISDITAPVSTLGPAEEMHALTLSQFRRLGQGANDITLKILQKFQNLQRESFALWSEAIRGWRTGEVYSLYLGMGRESLEQGISIAQVIEHRAAQQQPYLSEHEFNALADLNRKLQL